MKDSIKILLFLFAGFSTAAAQTQDSYDYNSEFTWGINKNSAGGLIGGFTFKKAKKRSDRVLETYGLEIVNVKHPQEVRRNSAYTGNFFIYGKSNYLYAIRLQYGRDFILFTKAPQQGVEIKAVFAAGPSIGVVAPYYIERTVDNSFFSSAHEQYNPNNPNHNYNNILGTGNLFEGIGDSKIQLGANLKAALNFELGFVKSQVTGFEVGILADAYANKVILMPTAENKSIYPTVFFTLFYGNRK
ncbi:MAG: hypothetical protein RI909_200 [Bacteroidota bacterium]|jgi:hypothetical protein